MIVVFEGPSVPQLCDFQLGVLENRNIGIGIRPELQEFLTGDFRFDPVPGQHQRACKLYVSYCADGIAYHNPWVIDNLVEFRRSSLPRLAAR